MRHYQCIIRKVHLTLLNKYFFTCMHLEMSSDLLLSELGFLKMYNFSAAHISSWSASFVRVSSLQQFRGNIVVHVLTFQFPHFLWYFCTVAVFIVCKNLHVAVISGFKWPFCTTNVGERVSVGQGQEFIAVCTKPRNSLISAMYVNFGGIPRFILYIAINFAIYDFSGTS